MLDLSNLTQQIADLDAEMQDIFRQVERLRDTAAEAEREECRIMARYHELRRLRNALKAIDRNPAPRHWKRR